MNENICTKCAKTNSTCCSITNKGNNTIFPLSKKEINKIQTYIKNNHFFNIQENNYLFISKLINLFPTEKKNILKKFKIKNNLNNQKQQKKNFQFYHFTLKLKQNKCYFLSKEGCLLPRKIRPFFCQIYPFWVIENKIIVFNDMDCLAIKKYKSISNLLKVFKTSQDEIIFLYQQYKNNLFEELR